jgi:hypothetical protein
MYIFDCPPPYTTEEISQALLGLDQALSSLKISGLKLRILFHGISPLADFYIILPRFKIAMIQTKK